MTQIVFFLLNHLWQSTLVAGLAWLACATMLRANRPGVRFGVWLAVSLKFLIPFTFVVEAGRWLDVRPLLSPSQSQQIFEIVSSGSGMLAAAPFRVSPGAPQATARSEELWLVAVLAVWTLGAGIVFSRWFKHWWAIRCLARDAQPAGRLPRRTGSQLTKNARPADRTGRIWASGANQSSYPRE